MFTKSIISISLSLAIACNCAGQSKFLGICTDKCTELHVLSVTRAPGGLIEVFERIKPRDGKLQDFREQVVASRKKLNLDADGFESLGYYRRKIRFDCYTQQYCVMEATYYDLYGNEIASDHPRGLVQWFKMPASTMREREYLGACRFVAKR